MSSTFVIAWRNLGRNRRRTALALAAIAIAQVSVLAIDGLMHGFVDSTLDSLTGPLMGHVQIHAPDFREERAPDLVIDDVDMRLTAVRRVQGVASAHARIYAPALAAQDVEGFAVVAVGVDFEAERAHGGLLEGLRGQTPGDREALIGEQLARQQGIEVGDELALVGTATDGSIANDLVRVAGILETPMEMISRSGVVMQLESAQEIFAMPDMAHEITVRGTGAPADAPALAARIRRAPTMGGLEVLPWMELAPELASFFSIAGLYGYFVMLIVFLAAAA
ncbi:MAG: ABC transporter permease, partial [Sandaracinaceae bacterium]